jgi:phosphoribosylaminoimidazolecarboxamide formyltransferase / IMP cyclohydrolase
MLENITRALISVSDKSNLENLINFLTENNIEIISTGGTYKKISQLTDKVKEVSEFTGAAEILDGRVKTLHPKIHGAILSKKDDPKHQQQLQENNISNIDLVIVNLYPFTETVASGADAAKIIENIDIGGPSMLRSAAKNFKYITVISDPADYDELITELKSNNQKTSLEFRQKMAVKTFAKTAKYDAAIYNWFSENDQSEKTDIIISATLKQKLRYGENPHQKAALYAINNSGIISGEQIQGKELSYNNINDSDNAYKLIQEFSEPAAAIIKHNNPCGVAIGADIFSAYTKALSSDPVSSFGGIIALNRPLDLKTAEKIKETFFEVIICSEIEPAAKTLLSSKKNMRIILQNSKDQDSQKITSVSGGLLIQDDDLEQISKDQLQIVTKRKPTEEETTNLLFAFKCIKHIRSNAIAFIQNGQTIGIGAGQMSRVDSVKIANIKMQQFDNYNEDAPLIIASDAFFPFADGVEIAAASGATAIIQPGGSKRDQEVIDAADKANIAMVFTGLRHFKH